MNDNIGLFLHVSLLESKPGRDFLRDTIENSTLTKRCIVTIGEDGEFEIVPASPAIAKSLVDSTFPYFVENCKNDGFIYLSLESIKRLLKCSID